MIARGRPAGRTRKRGLSQGSLLWLLGLVCGAGIVLIGWPAAIGVAMLAPALLALATETAPGRPTGRTMLLFGAAAALGSVGTLLHDPSPSGALTGDPWFVIRCWAAQAAGALLSLGAPAFVRLALDALAAQAIRRLRAEQAALAEEWNLADSRPPPQRQGG
jgi:hypothetical protein